MKIDGIPTNTFYQMTAELCSEQWRVASEYAGFDKGIDYDFIVLKRHGVNLKFVWVLYLEGSVDGPDSLVQKLRERYSL